MALPRGVESGLKRARSLKEKISKTATKIERDASLQMVYEGLEETQAATLEAIEEMRKTLDEVKSLAESMQGEESVREDLETIKWQADKLVEDWRRAELELDKIKVQMTRISAKMKKNALEGFFKDETNEPLEVVGVSIEEMEILLHAEEADQEKLIKTYFGAEGQTEWEEMLKNSYNILGFLEKRILRCTNIEMRNKALADLFVEFKLKNEETGERSEEQLRELKSCSEKALDILSEVEPKLKELGFEVTILLPTQLHAVRTDGDQIISLAINETFSLNSDLKNIERFSNENSNNSAYKNYEASVMVRRKDDKSPMPLTGYADIVGPGEDSLSNTINAKAVEEATKMAFKNFEVAKHAKDEEIKERERLEAEEDDE